MNKALKTSWIAALRSGAYQQGDGYLVQSVDVDDNLRFCCLGVLGAVCGLSVERMRMDATLDDVQRQDLLGPWDEPGPTIGFRCDKPETQTTMQRKLAAMNDNECTFEEIADWIETNVPTE